MGHSVFVESCSPIFVVVFFSKLTLFSEIFQLCGFSSEMHRFDFHTLLQIFQFSSLPTFVFLFSFQVVTFLRYTLCLRSFQNYACFCVLFIPIHVFMKHIFFSNTHFRNVYRSNVIMLFLMSVGNTGVSEQRMWK